MKRSNLFSILIASFLMYTFTGCDNTDPISLGGVTEVNLYLDADPHNIDLEGGDGSYSVTSNDPGIVRAELVVPATLRIYPVTVGITTIMISDQSGNNFRLMVTVSYRTTTVYVDSFGVFIDGDLADDDKEEIEEEALKTIPVINGGGYLFTYTGYDKKSGEAIIYPEKFGEKGITTTFEIVEHDKYEWKEVYGFQGYAVNIDDEIRVFMPGPRPAIKSTAPASIGFVEDVTDLFKEKGYDVERVLTIQLATVF